MAEIEVLAADQAKINKFGNLNTQCTALKMELETLEKKNEQFKTATDYLEEAELMGDIETVPYQVGTAFIELPLSTASEEITKDKAEVDEKVNSLKSQIAAKEQEMDLLRTALYGKFGRENINLG